MPKTNLCKSRVDPKEAELKALIIGGMIKRDITRANLSKRTNIPISTLNYHIRNIREMRVGELWDILAILQPEDAEKVKVL